MNILKAVAKIANTVAQVTIGKHIHVFNAGRVQMLGGVPMVIRDCTIPGCTSQIQSIMR